MGRETDPNTDTLMVSGLGGRGYLEGLGGGEGGEWRRGERGGLGWWKEGRGCGGLGRRRGVWGESGGESIAYELLPSRKENASMSCTSRIIIAALNSHGTLGSCSSSESQLKIITAQSPSNTCKKGNPWLVHTVLKKKALEVRVKPRT